MQLASLCWSSTAAVTSWRHPTVDILLRTNTYCCPLPACLHMQLASLCWSSTAAVTSWRHPTVDLLLRTNTYCCPLSACLPAYAAGFPVLVIHGRSDKLASPANAEALARRLQAPCVML
jgi:pimeloyl-ACP methyl ester carboxylesterase